MVRQYLALKPTPQLRTTYGQAYRSGQLDLLQNYLVGLLSTLGAPERLHRNGALTVTAAPSLDWTAHLVGDAPDAPILENELDELIIAHEVGDPDLLSTFRDFIAARVRRSEGDDDVLWIGADPGGDIADHWCPAGSETSSFGRRSDARRSMNIDVLDAGLPRPGQNAKVNVVIIDQGLNREAVLASHPHSWGGGWVHHGHRPGEAPRTSHGMLVARNILDIAPDAVVYDVPLIPKPAIDSVPLFASTANACYRALRLWINLLRTRPRWSGPWIFVNAWAIYDRSSEAPIGDYTENSNKSDPYSIGHRLNKAVADAALKDRIDVVFAAGNCGTFCPAARCGKLDRGPGRSIWGANSSSATITAGAVLTNDMWLGYSSQGPGQQRLGHEKPDISAPSVFAETNDARMLNGGTSTACALTAGVVASLRKGWSSDRVSPQVLKQTLIDGARRIHGPGWSARTGHGVLDAGAAFGRLCRDYPASAVSQATVSPQEIPELAQRQKVQTGADQASLLGRLVRRFKDIMRTIMRG